MRSTTGGRRDMATLLKQYSTFILLVFILVINLIFTSNFFQIGTMWNIITQTCCIILTGMGMTVVISTGGIDISVGSVMALAGVVAAAFVNKLGVVPTMIVAVLICSIFGAIAGFMIGILKLQAMVVTLALQMTVRGIAQLVNDGKIMYLEGAHAEAFMKLGSARFGNLIPVQVVPIILAVLLTWFLMEKTIFGRHIQAVGDNPNSSKLVGIHNGKTLMMAYVYSAAFAALAGLITAAKTSAADANSLGDLAELDAIAAVAVGGTSMSGGRAKVFGTVIGALIMQLITITVNMNNIQYEYAQVLKAIIIVIAVYIQRDKTT